MTYGKVLLGTKFTGIGSEGYQALRLGRRFIGTELKPSYFAQACRNLEWIETHGQSQMGLFAHDETIEHATA